MWLYGVVSGHSRSLKIAPFDRAHSVPKAYMAKPIDVVVLKCR